MRTYVATYNVDNKYSNKLTNVNLKEIKVKYAKGLSGNIVAYVTLIGKNRFDLRGKRRSVEKLLKKEGKIEKIVSIG